MMKRSTIFARTLIVIGASFLIVYPFMNKHLSERLPILMDGDANTSPSYHLVVASTSKQDLNWLSRIPNKWRIKRYITDNVPQDSSMSLNRAPNLETLAVPRHQGREAMAYLSYIIDHYDTLPDYALFVHGHMRSWHQVMPLDMLVRGLNQTALEEEKYISLQCSDVHGCEALPALDTLMPRTNREKKICLLWDVIRPGIPCPLHLGSKCCAQFAVTRDAIKSLSREDWIGIREPLTYNYSTDARFKGIYETDWEITDWDIGWVFEKLWHVFFGMPDVYCPNPSHCRRVHFSNSIACSGNMDNMDTRRETWEDIQCVSAFDKLEKDDTDEEKLKSFVTSLEDTMFRLGTEAGDRKIKLLEAV